jgi:hypothetical protein
VLVIDMFAIVVVGDEEVVVVAESTGAVRTDAEEPHAAQAHANTASATHRGRPRRTRS